jgi:hypothetical protein
MHFCGVERAPMQLDVSHTRVIHLHHSLLLGKSRGLFICACIECGAFLGAAQDLHFLALRDSMHNCSGLKKPIAKPPRRASAA